VVTLASVDLSLFFAGTAGSVPSARRGLPATLLRRGGDRVLFDCGEGTQRQLVRSTGLADITHVFLTHFHADHWLGLPGMLKSFDLRDRDRPLSVLGPPGTKAIMEAVRFVYGRLRYPLEIRELEPGEIVRWEDWYVAPFAVRHRGPAAFGYAIVEDPRPGRFDAELAERLGVPPGPAFGALQRGETINGVTPEQVIGEERPGRKLVLSGDTAPCETLRVAAHQADVLVHEATFASDEAERAAQTQHSTARQAAEIARDAEVGMLALTHLSSRYGGREIRDEARETFENTVVPRDFDAIEVPFPERGEPELVRWDDERARTQQP
jgi:ribonuclease Z